MPEPISESAAKPPERDGTASPSASPLAEQPREPAADPGTEPVTDDALPPSPVLRATVRRPRFSLIWLLPMVAVLIALSFAVHNWLQTGPRLQLHFKTAEGLVAGKSQVRYKEVVIGTVQRIELEDNGEGVVVSVQLERSAARIANRDSKFWIVRPQLGLGGVSGLNTLLSGAYVGVDAGSYDSPSQLEFVGLEQPPTVMRDSKGRRFRLLAPAMGSLGIGSPVYYRRMQVGRMTSFTLDPSGKQVAIEIFVDHPYDGFVNGRTRFWNASGVDVSVSSDGFKVNTESLASIVAGGIAFGDRPRSVSYAAAAASAPAPQAAPENAVFTLYDNQKQAFATREEPPVMIRMRYDQSIRGLAINAPVELQGKAIGEVLDTSVDYDEARKSFFVWVDAALYPRQLGAAYWHFQQQEGGRLRTEAARRQQDLAFVRYLITHGYRAQLKNGNLLTGQLYVSLEHGVRTAASAATVATAGGDTLIFPSLPGGIDQLQNQLASIASRLEKVRFDQIGSDLQRTLHSATAALDTANRSLQTLTPEARKALVDAQHALQSADATLQKTQGTLAPGGLTDQASDALQEVRKAARSVRMLSDSLQAQPDALLRGRSEQMSPIRPVPSPSSRSLGE
ncbi:intermembrane transport protein PqiB [Brachymonas sp. M4Q-1]|uniref:PqiB family protein n=1 Tax=Brachymonas sp. M4Q-1 TaxID=3416906 RepID=UPI003CF91278